MTNEQEPMNMAKSINQYTQTERDRGGGEKEGDRGGGGACSEEMITGKALNYNVKYYNPETSRASQKDK